MSSRGFSLIELIGVLAIAGIILAIATLDFNSMLQKGQIETQTKEMLSEINSLRINAMQKKQRSAVFLGPKQMVFKSYTSNAENALPPGGTEISRKNLKKEIRNLSDMATPLNVTADLILFDTRGYSSNITLVVLPVMYNSADNCILVSTARTNIGRMADATTCTAR
jgi:prepilin-type N-terminal cleavage/methylation domain-containing protein